MLQQAHEVERSKAAKASLKVKVAFEFQSNPYPKPLTFDQVYFDKKTNKGKLP